MSISGLAKSTTVVLGLVLMMAMDQARAASIPIFSTGVDASGNPLANGAADPHWTVTLNTTGTPNTPAGQAQVVTGGYPVPPWYDPSAHGLDARWITPSPFSSNWGDGEIDYSQTFTGATNISLSLTSDDGVLDVLVNGHSLGIKATDWSTFFGPFSIPNSDLTGGANTLVIRTTNSGGVVTGVLVSIAASAVPEPGSIVLLGIGLGGLFACRRLFVRATVS